MENNEFEKVRIENPTCYYFNDMIISADFDLDNILIDENWNENILIYDISCKSLIDPNPFQSRFFKMDVTIIIYDRTRYLPLFGPEKMIVFTTELDIL